MNQYKSIYMERAYALRFSIIFMTVISCLSMTAAQGTTPFFRTGEVKCVANDARLVTVKSMYTASTVADAQRWAERNAVENLLFKGVAGCYDVPLVADEASSFQQHQVFYDWLIVQREFDRFVTDRSVQSKKLKKKSYWVEETMTFDMVALRTELEKKGIIKKFGF
jgi:hypothetical protein